MPTPSPTPTSPAPDETARALLEAITTRDYARVRGLLAPDVWTRALLTRRVDEHHDADGAVQALREWHDSAGPVHVLAVGHHSMEGREFLSYRLQILPLWAPDTWHVIEQSGFCRAAAGRVTRLDLACTGYFPVDAPAEDLRPAAA